MIFALYADPSGSTEPRPGDSNNTLLLKILTKLRDIVLNP